MTSQILPVSTEENEEVNISTNNISPFVFLVIFVLFLFAAAITLIAKVLNYKKEKKEKVAKDEELKKQLEVNISNKI